MGAAVGAAAAGAAWEWVGGAVGVGVVLEMAEPERITKMGWLQRLQTSCGCVMSEGVGTVMSAMFHRCNKLGSGASTQGGDSVGYAQHLPAWDHPGSMRFTTDCKQSVQCHVPEGVGPPPSDGVWRVCACCAL